MLYLFMANTKQERELFKTQIAGYPEYVQETALEIFDKLRILSDFYVLAVGKKSEVIDGYFTVSIEHSYAGITAIALKTIISVKTADCLGAKVKDGKITFMFEKAVI